MKVAFKKFVTSLLGATIGFSVILSTNVALAANQSTTSPIDPSTAPIFRLLPSQAQDFGAPVGVSSAWTAVVTNPNLYYMGSWYYGPYLYAPTGTPSTGYVDNITWSWNIWNYRSDLITYLCELTYGRCLDISGNFNGGASLKDVVPKVAPNTTWIYAFKVPGSGALSPVLYGQTGSIAVTYY